MNKKILFLAEYTKENLLLAQELCYEKGSSAFFWENEELKNSKMNYFDIMDSTSEEMVENFFVISGGQKSEDFILKIAEILTKWNYDIVLTRGQTSQIWPISLVKNHFSITSGTFVALLDRMTKFVEFDENVLDAFDIILGMGPSSLEGKFSYKTEILFNKKELSYYMDAQNFLEDSIVILCNKNNIEKISKHSRLKSEDISFVDPEHCPDEELSIILNLAGIIIDESYFEEIKWALLKMGKKSFTLEQFFEGNKEALLEESKDAFLSNERKKVFFSVVKKEIENRLKKINHSPQIVGSTIRLGD